jgi:hypothetical protein
VRSEWGNAGAPVTAAAVQAARKAGEGRTDPWPSIQELQEFVAASGS